MAERDDSGGERTALGDSMSLIRAIQAGSAVSGDATVDELFRHLSRATFDFLSPA